MTASLFQAKNLCPDANLSELSHNSEDLVRITSLHRKRNVKVQLISYLLNERLRNNCLNCRIGY